MRSGRTMNSTGSGYRMARGIRWGLGTTATDVLLGMRGGIGAVLGATVRRDVLVERALSFRCELGELEAVAAVAAVATAAAAAKAGVVRRPDAGDLLRIERHVRVVDAGIARTASAAARARRWRTVTGPARPALADDRRRGEHDPDDCCTHHSRHSILHRRKPHGPAART